jgi:hypothetical protein
MINKLRLHLHYALTALKYWQIIVLGIVTTAAAVVLASCVAHLCYSAFPDAWGWVMAGHLILAGLTAWFVPAPFIDACLYKQAMATYAAAWKHLLETLSEGPCEDGCELPDEDGDCGDSCRKDAPVA